MCSDRGRNVRLPSFCSFHRILPTAQLVTRKRFIHFWRSDKRIKPRSDRRWKTERWANNGLSRKAKALPGQPKIRLGFFFSARIHSPNAPHSIFSVFCHGLDLPVWKQLSFFFFSRSYCFDYFVGCVRIELACGANPSNNRGFLPPQFQTDGSLIPVLSCAFGGLFVRNSLFAHGIENMANRRANV